MPVRPITSYLDQTYKYEYTYICHLRASCIPSSTKNQAFHTGTTQQYVLYMLIRDTYVRSLDVLGAGCVLSDAVSSAALSLNWILIR